MTNLGASVTLIIRFFLQTGTNFFQGLYPPLGELDSELSVETLNNGSETTAPLNKC